MRKEARHDDGDGQDKTWTEAVRTAARPPERGDDAQAVLGLVGDAHFVLPGEAAPGGFPRFPP